MTLPRVVIIGRPNVGKSTLFNRISGQRRAIVDRVAGSTRDRNVVAVDWARKRFEVVDTGGLFETPPSEMDKLIAAQCGQAMQSATIICFVVDGRAGMLPEDVAIARRLRAHAEKVLLVVNKIDHVGRLTDAFEFHKLGFEHLYEVSSEYGLGVAELMDEIARRLPEIKAAEMEDETRIAIVGRPNVGKSSLLNALVGEERVVVSPYAGTTRDAVDTVFRTALSPSGVGVGPHAKNRNERAYRIVDTAGIRRRGKISSRADEIGVLYAERALERAHVCLLVVDATSGFTREDATIAGRIGDAGRGAILVVNKWDLVERREDEAKRMTKEAARKLRHLDFAPLAFVSALSGKGVSRLLPLVDRVRAQQLKTIPTPELNRFLTRVTKSHPPRARGGKEVKFFYTAQTGVAPPRFTVFTNLTREVDASYIRYVARVLREEYGFEGTPLKVVLRKRAAKGAPET